MLFKSRGSCWFLFLCRTHKTPGSDIFSWGHCWVSHRRNPAVQVEPKSTEYSPRSSLYCKTPDWNTCWILLDFLQENLFIAGSLPAGGHVSCMNRDITSYCKESEAVRAAQPSTSLWGFPLGNISRQKHRMGWARILLMNSCRWHVMELLHCREWHPYSGWLLWQTYHRGSQQVFLHVGGDRRRRMQLRPLPAMICGICFLIWSFFSSFLYFPLLFPSVRSAFSLPGGDKVWWREAGLATSFSVGMQEGIPVRPCLIGGSY